MRAMRGKNQSIKKLSYVFAATAVILFIATIIMAMSGGFINPIRFAAILILCAAFVFSVLGTIFSLIYKAKGNVN